MKNLSLTTLKFTPVLGGLVLSLLAGPAKAAVFYWDNNGAGTPTSGTWDTTSSQWATTSVLNTGLTSWNTADAACFTAGSGVTGTINITVNQAITMAGIFNGALNPSGVALTISGSGSFNLPSGVQAALDTGGSDSQPTVVNIPFTGAGQLWPEGSKNCTLNATSTHTGGTVLDQTGLLFFSANNSFGTGPTYPFITGSPGFAAILSSGGTVGTPLTITLDSPIVISTYNAGINFADAAYTPVVLTTKAYVNLLNPANIRNAGGPTSPITFNGQITNYSSLNLSANASSGFIVNGANTYGGGTTLSSGNSGVYVQAGNQTALGYGPVTVNSASTLDLAGYGLSNSIAFSGTGTNNNGGLINSTATAVTLNPGQVGSIAVTAGGSGSAPNVTLSGGGGSGATATAILGVTASSFSVTAGTQKYTVAPTITIGHANGYTVGGGASTGGATATAALAGTAPSVISTTITVTGAGADFSVAPTITFSGGTTSGTGTAPTGSGNTTHFTVVGVAITSPGSGYTSAPTVAFSTGGATATAAIPSIKPSNGATIGGTGDITINEAFANTSTFQVGKIGADTLTLGGTLDNGFAGLNITNGTVILNKASTSGVHALGSTTLVGNGATLQLSGTGGDQIYSGVNLTNNGGVFDANGKNESLTTLALGGTGVGSGGALINSAASTTSTITGTGTPGFPLVANASIGGVGNLTLIGAFAGPFGLTKVGTGSAILDPANTYSGATTVSAGTLEIVYSIASTTVTVADQATLKLDAPTGLVSSASLQLQSGAPSVNLNYVGVMPIASMSFDGGSTFVTAGTWGSSTSGAANTDTRLTGPGLLDVGVAAPASALVNLDGTPSSYGDPMDLQFTFSGGAGPTGNVTFYDGATSLGSAAVDGTGTATLPTFSSLGAGNHNLLAVYPGDGTYYAASANWAQVINPAVIQVNATNQTKVYGQTLAVGPGSFAFQALGLQNGDTIGSVTLACPGAIASAPVGGSPYTITASAATGGTFIPANYTINYNVTPGQLTVTAAPLSISGNGTMVYGNDPATAVYTPVYYQLQGTDTVSSVHFTGAPSYSTDAASTNYINSFVGSNYTVFPDPTGLSDPNYTITAGTNGILTITTRPLTVTNVITADRTYDGTTNEALDTTGAGFSGFVNGDDASVTLDASLATGTFANKNVGVAKPVTIAGIVTAGILGTNYNVVDPTTNTASVTQLAITVTAAADVKTYTATTASAGVPTPSPALATGDTGNFTQTFDTKDVGTGKTLTPAGLVNDGNSGNNYSYTYSPVTTGEIDAKAITVTAVTTTRLYNGTTASAGVPTSPGIIPPDTANFTQSYDTRNAGAGKTLTPAGVANDGDGGADYSYTYASVSTGVINQTNLTVTAVANTKPYDGDISATAVPTITAGSIQTGDAAPTWTETYDNANIGTGKTLTPAGVVLDGNGGLNYAYTYATVATGVINAALSTTNTITSIVNNNNGTFTLGALGTPGANYYIVSTNDITAPFASWPVLPGSTNMAAIPTGLWSFVVSNAAPSYYRSIAINPHP